MTQQRHRTGIYVTRHMRSQVATSAYARLRALAKMEPAERGKLVRLANVRIQHFNLADPE